MRGHQRFWAKVQKTEACWLWTAGTRNGYGRYSLGSKSEGVQSAHRFSYELHKGKIPLGLYVCHTCDNKLCVNPDHLYAGSAKDNMKDSVERNRLNPAKGSRNGQSVLTEEEVTRLRAQIPKGAAAKQKLAEEYGVSLSTIYKIAQQRRWRTP